MEVAFPPGFFRTLGELPVVEPGAEAACHRLMFFCPIIVTQTVVGQPQGFGEHPPFAVVLVQE